MASITLKFTRVKKALLPNRRRSPAIAHRSFPFPNRCIARAFMFSREIIRRIADIGDAKTRQALRSGNRLMSEEVDATGRGTCTLTLGVRNDSDMTADDQEVVRGTNGIGADEYRWRVTNARYVKDTYEPTLH